MLAVPEYHRDIAPILERRCTGCHRKGEIGPMPLDIRTGAPLGQSHSRSGVAPQDASVVRRLRPFRQRSFAYTKRRSPPFSSGPTPRRRKASQVARRSSPQHRHKRASRLPRQAPFTFPRRLNSNTNTSSSNRTSRSRAGSAASRCAPVTAAPCIIWWSTLALRNPPRWPAAPAESSSRPLLRKASPPPISRRLHTRQRRR